MEQNNEPSYSLFSYTSSENHYNFWNTTIGSFSFGIGVFTPMPIATYLHVQCITLWSLSSFFTRGMLVFFPIILVKILQYTNKWNQFHVYTFFIYIYTHTQYHWFYKLKYLPTNRIFTGFYLRIEFLRWCLIRD